MQDDRRHASDNLFREKNHPWRSRCKNDQPVLNRPAQAPPHSICARTLAEPFEMADAGIDDMRRTASQAEVDQKTFSEDSQAVLRSQRCARRLRCACLPVCAHLVARASRYPGE